MTDTTSTTSTTSTAQEHPDWCHEAWCQVETDSRHARAVGQLRTDWGSDLMVGLSLERRAAASEVRVQLLEAASTDFEDDVDDSNRWERGWRLQLEPEEARLLARRLLQAADEWERVTGGQAAR